MSRVDEWGKFFFRLFRVEVASVSEGKLHKLAAQRQLRYDRTSLIEGNVHRCLRALLLCLIGVQSVRGSALIFLEEF